MPLNYIKHIWRKTMLYLALVYTGFCLEFVFNYYCYYYFKNLQCERDGSITGKAINHFTFSFQLTI